MKKISIIGIIYLIAFVLLAVAAALGLFVAISTGSVATFPGFLPILLVAFGLCIFGVLWSSALRAHKAWAWPWGIVFVSAGLISGIASSLFIISPLSIVGVLFGAFVLYSLISEKEIFFPIQPDSVMQRPSLWRTLVVPFVVLIVLIIGAGLMYYYFYYITTTQILPAEGDDSVKTAITFTIVNASSYSLNNEISNNEAAVQDNYLGYNATLQNTTPKCSGPLIVNISSDGTKIAVMGKSCSDPSMYYCESLPPLPQVQYMATIPSSSVSSTRFDCSGGTQLQSASGVPIIQPLPVIGQPLHRSMQGSPSSLTNISGSSSKVSIGDVTPNATTVTTLKAGDYYHITWSSPNLPSGAVTSINLEVNGHKILIATNIQTGQNYYNWHVYRYPTDLTGSVSTYTKYDFNVSATYNGGSSYVANISSGFYLQ